MSSGVRFGFLKLALIKAGKSKPVKVNTSSGVARRSRSEASALSIVLVKQPRYRKTESGAATVVKFYAEVQDALVLLNYGECLI